ncbi:hypothetical protein ACFSMW_17145 [Virgibacillus halophilus]|uniref:hypothetical protein n=1 Tax=Tigheibacillus halophilus TaxID=361280 RepID=UPI0036453A6A
MQKAKNQIKQTLLQQQAKPAEEVLNKLNKKIEVKDKAFKEVFKVDEQSEGNNNQ